MNPIGDSPIACTSPTKNHTASPAITAVFTPAPNRGRIAAYTHSRPIPDTKSSATHNGIAMDSAIPLWVALDFVSGIGLLWVYAAIRPRFGAGVKTAVIAGLAVWFFVGLVHAIGESPMGFMPERLMVIGTCVALVSIPVATVVGAYVYK